MTLLKLKRAYDPVSATDGFRVYIDRLWPRGLSHETFIYDVWDKEIAPSDELRHWFHHNPEATAEGFAAKYRRELDENPKWNDFVAIIEPHEMVTLLYSSHNETMNNADIVSEKLCKDLPSKFKTT